MICFQVTTEDEAQSICIVSLLMVTRVEWNVNGSDGVGAVRQSDSDYHIEPGPDSRVSARVWR